jgi:hypothetical protein
MIRGNFEKRVARLEMDLTDLPAMVICYTYHIFNEEERRRNREAAIAEWEARNGLALDTERTKFVECSIVTRREEIAGRSVPS